MAIKKKLNRKARCTKTREYTTMLHLLMLKLGYSFAGLRDTWCTELSFRQWFLLVIVSDVAAVFCAPNITLGSLVVALGFLLLAAELINTAVEAIVDKTTPEIHTLAKKAKDAGSATTLMTFFALLTVWIGIWIQ